MTTRQLNAAFKAMAAEDRRIEAQALALERRDLADASPGWLWVCLNHQQRRPFHQWPAMPARRWYATHGLEVWQLRPRGERPRCGAATRTGRPCMARVVRLPCGAMARRCRMHGGLSTGPRTEAGRAAVSMANSRRRGTRYKVKARS